MAETLKRWSFRVDSKSALALAKNPVFHEQSKHIRVRYHFIRGCLDEGSIKTGYIKTKDQLADLLTKPLGRIKFLELYAPGPEWSNFRGRVMDNSCVLLVFVGLQHMVLAWTIAALFSILDCPL